MNDEFSWNLVSSTEEVNEKMYKLQLGVEDMSVQSTAQGLFFFLSKLLPVMNAFID